MRLLMQCLRTKTLLSVRLSKFYSSEVPVAKVKRVQVSKDLVLRTVALNRHYADSTKASSPPLVVLFEWLGAKSKAVDRYCQFYHERGLDVLTVKGGLLEFLWPKRAFTKARGVLDYLQSNTSPVNPGCVQRKYLIHAFSVGAYNHTVSLMVSQREATKYGWYKENISGSVFDSIVIGTLDNMVTGMALSFSNSPLVQAMVRQIGRVYFHLNPERTLRFYDEAVSFFKTQPVIAPSLYVFCHDDPMSDAQSIRDMIDLWEREFPAIQVSVQSWEHSAHAAHIKYHETEYKETLDKFCTSLHM